MYLALFAFKKWKEKQTVAIPIMSLNSMKADVISPFAALNYSDCGQVSKGWAIASLLLFACLRMFAQFSAPANIIHVEQK